MKKTTSKSSTKKTTKRANVVVKPVKPAVRPVIAQPKPAKTRSASLYFFWFIIVFFIAATFYILGRSHNAMNVSTTNNVTVSEETLLQASDYYESGKTKLLAGNIDDAIIDLTTAIETGAATVDTYVLRGEAYMQSSDYASALADLDSAIAMEPKNSVAYYDRAIINTRLEDYNAALADINNALAARVENPNDILQLRDLYAKRGQLNLWLKNWEGAIADYTNSLARPDGVVSPNVYAERAEAYTAIGNYADAIADYSSAIRVISEQIQAITSYEERARLSSNAMSYFEKSAALNLNLGYVEGARNDLSSAREIAAKLSDADTVDRLDALMMNLPE